MDSKAPVSSLCQHKETRISLEPTVGSSIIQFQLPSTGGTFTRGPRLQRKVFDAISICKTEDEFKWRHVASASSIYFRSPKRYPRCILWRCLEQNKVLELRSVDISKSQREGREAALILRLVFPNAIRTGGVALADSEQEDILSVFVLTNNKQNDLYTFTLRPNFFCHAAASEDDLDRWCKTSNPPSLGISTPYRLFALTSNELLISIADGRCARLRRKSGDDGSAWDEVTYSGGQWSSSLRGFLSSWQGLGTIRFEGTALDQNTAMSAISSPDGHHLIAVCLNHTLRFWNKENGKQTILKDLLDVPREPQDTTKVALDPGLPKNLEVFETSPAYDGDQYYVLTFSPHLSGLFKLWAIRDANHDESGIRDLFPDDSLRIPDPDDGALWNLSDYRVRADPTSSKLDVWVLLRLNRRYKLYCRKFDSIQTLGDDWQCDWSVTAIDTSRRASLLSPPLKTSELDPEDISDKWLRFLFCPHQLPESVLETALNLYNQPKGIVCKNSKVGLKERIASCVGSQVTLKSSGSSDPIALYREQLSDEWNSLWNIVAEINHIRWEPSSLGFDSYADMPWIVLGDGCAAVRECSEIEVLAHNRPKDLSSNNGALLIASVESDEGPSQTKPQDELALLIDAAAKFRIGFSESLRLSCSNAINQELWEEPSSSVSERIQAFHSSCGFHEEISDRQYEDLVSSLGQIGGFDGLITESFDSILEKLSDKMDQKSGRSSTKFGIRTLVRGVQDMIALHAQTMTDLLVLVVFVELEVSREEFPMDDFNANEVYTALLDQLKKIRLVEWVVSNTRADPNTATDHRGAVTTSQGKSTVRVSTVLENLFSHDIEPQHHRNKTQSTALTHTIRDTITWVTAGDMLSLDHVATSIFCNLIKDHNLELATSFVPFQPSTPWACYLLGRLCLLIGDYNEAAANFSKAAFHLSRATPPSSHYEEISSGLIDPVTARLFSAGLSSFYSHIVDLFSPHRIHTQVVAFARLALQQIDPQKAKPEYSDLLARLFHASLAISDFSVAYSALARYTDSALQKAALTSLVTTMANTAYVSELVQLPFVGLQREVDNLLSGKARAEALSAQLSSNTVPYYKILYAWRLQRGDLRGAAAVLVERLEFRRDRKSNHSLKFGGGAKEAEKGLDEYLLGINALSLIGGEDERWVFIEGPKEGEKRRVITLNDLRARYQEEMDRVGMLEMGRFGIVGEDEDDSDVEME